MVTTQTRPAPTHEPPTRGNAIETEGPPVTAKRRHWSHSRTETTIVDRPASFADLPDVPRVFVSSLPRGADLDRWLAGADVSVFLDGHHVVIRDDARTVLDARQYWNDEDSFSADLALCSWHWVDRRLDRDFGGALLSTPGTTGRDLWLRTPAADGCPTMSAAMQTLVRTTAGQGRVETMPATTPLVPGLFEYDLRLAYAACLRGLPVGEPEDVEAPALDDVRRLRSRALVRFRVPRGWDRVGILGVPSERGWSWPTTPDRWHGPVWLDGCEIDLALEHGWSVEVDRALVWERTGEPLRTWSERLRKMIDEARETLSPAGADHVRSIVRAVLLHTVGAFHGRPQRVTCYAGALEDVPIGADSLRPHEDGRYSWREERPAAWPEAVHPEWSAHVWARARRRFLVTPGGGGALTVPRREVVAIRTDAVYLTRPTDWADHDDGKPGRWVLKSADERRRPWPRTGDDVLALKRGTR